MITVVPPDAAGEGKSSERRSDLDDWEPERLYQAERGGTPSITRQPDIPHVARACSDEVPTWGEVLSRIKNGT